MSEWTDTEESKCREKLQQWIHAKIHDRQGWEPDYEGAYLQQIVMKTGNVKLAETILKEFIDTEKLLNPDKMMRKFVILQP